MQHSNVIAQLAIAANRQAEIAAGELEDLPSCVNDNVTIGGMLAAKTAMLKALAIIDAAITVHSELR